MVPARRTRNHIRRTGQAEKALSSGKIRMEHGFEPILGQSAGYQRPVDRTARMFADDGEFVELVQFEFAQIELPEMVNLRMQEMMQNAIGRRRHQSLNIGMPQGQSSVANLGGGQDIPRIDQFGMKIDAS